MILGQRYGIDVSTDLSSWSVLAQEHYNLSQTPESGKYRMRLELTQDYGARVFMRISQP